MQHIKQQLDEAIKQFIAQNNGTPHQLYEPINYSLSLGGKRLRPTLLMLACEVFGGDVGNAIAPAMGIELFHNFTLLHDDIMDNAPMRRSQPTVHEKWNNNIAILSGDTMFAQAYQLVMQTKHSKVLELFNLFSKTAIQVCEGQQLDMNFETENSVSINDYLKMIELKTAVLLACALQMGSTIANANDDDCNNVYEFGKNIGIAFQLQDDILDVFGNQENFGKIVGGDIVSNKKTYLLLKSFELADDAQTKQLNSWLNYTEDTVQKVEGVKHIYKQLNVKQLAENKMFDYYNLGLQFLDKTSLPSDKKAMLKKFADELMVRVS